MRFDNVKCYASAAFIGLLGVAFFLVNAARFVSFDGPTVDLLLAGLGMVLSLVLVGAGGLLLHYDLQPNHALRVAGWAALGTVVLGLVLALIGLSDSELPAFAGATLLAVSAFAHVLIGVRDVQRIRVKDVERQREKLSVLNRLVRHNLSHVAQQLLFVRSQLPDATDEQAREDLSAQIEERAAGLTEMNDQLSESQRLIEDERPARQPVELAPTLADVVAEYREAYPDADIALATESDGAVVGGNYLHHAVAELVENAVEHTGEDPSVTVESRSNGTRAAIEVADTGPGVPESEQSLMRRETDISQLNHSQGLGLWFVRWVADAVDGDLDIDADDDGTTVRLEVPYAA